MGRQIVYCDQCGKLLKEQDFEQRRAHVVENRSFCVECRPLPAEPTPKKNLSSSHAIPLPQGSSSRTIPRISPGSSTRFSPVEPAPRAKSKAPILVGAGVAGGVVLVVLAMLLSGGQREEDRQAVVVAPPSPAPTGSSNPPPPPPVVASPLEDAAKKAYGEAIEFQRRNVKDLGGQIERFMKISEAYRGTSVAEVAVAEAAKVRLAIKEQVFALDQQAQAFARAEDFGKAIELVEKERGRHAAAEWASSTQELSARLRTEAGRLYGIFKTNAIQSKRKSDAEQLRLWSERVARLNLPEYAADLSRELAAVTPEAAQPAAPAVPPAVEAYRAGWHAAMALAAARDVAGAVAALEKAAGDDSVKAEWEADLALLKGLQGFHAEAAALLSKTPKGQKIAIEYWDASGNAAKVEEAVARIDAHRIEVKPVTISYGEVRGRTLAAAWLARPGKKPEDAKVAALACLLERDLEGSAGLDPRFAAWAAALPAEEGKEAEARKLFHGAETAWFDPARMQEAAEAYRKLLAEFGDTPFVRRNRAAIAGRTELPKEFMFLHDDLAAAGGFKQGKSRKVEVCWTSEKDLEEAQRKSNFVEFSFPVLANAAYRCWAYVGGCCQEVFSFSAQGTEMTGPDPKNPRQSVPAEPGTDADAPVKAYISGLKKQHKDHLGPKEPDRWEWVSVPLPKYASAGTKVVRILTDQKGFSVGYVVVSATRPNVPSDREIAIEEKRRSETPGFMSQGLPSMGVILREWWTGIGGTGIGDLTKHPNFPDKPTGFDLVPAFDAPINWADEYGTRMRGYVLPPATGEYVFWITTDDHGELFLSTDDNPANKKKIASAPEWAAAEEWEKNGPQKSSPVKLDAGKRYYIEALQKEGGGGDHLRVGWQLPDGKQERPIPGIRLAPCAPPRK